MKIKAKLATHLGVGSLKLGSSVSRLPGVTQAEEEGEGGRVVGRGGGSGNELRHLVLPPLGFARPPGQRTLLGGGGWEYSSPLLDPYLLPAVSQPNQIRPGCC